MNKIKMNEILTLLPFLIPKKYKKIGIISIIYHKNDIYLFDKKDESDQYWEIIDKTYDHIFIVKGDNLTIKAKKYRIDDNEGKYETHHYKNDKYNLYNVIILCYIPSYLNKLFGKIPSHVFIDCILPYVLYTNPVLSSLLLVNKKVHSIVVNSKQCELLQSRFTRKSMRSSMVGVYCNYTPYSDKKCPNCSWNLMVDMGINRGLQCRFCDKYINNPALKINYSDYKPFSGFDIGGTYSAEFFPNCKPSGVCNY